MSTDWQTATMFVADPRWFDSLFAWFELHEDVLAIAFVASIVMFVGGIVGVPWLVIRMPADFFLRHDRPRPYRHPVVHVVLVIARNVIGAAFLFAGIAMLVLPGQGLLTILVAIALLDFPGKRRVELALVRRKPLHRLIDWIRAKAHRPPIVLPEVERH